MKKAPKTDKNVLCCAKRVHNALYKMLLLCNHYITDCLKAFLKENSCWEGANKAHIVGPGGPFWWKIVADRVPTKLI